MEKIIRKNLLIDLWTSVRTRWNGLNNQQEKITF